MTCFDSIPSYFNKTDEKEPIEMNAGACANKQCNEYIDFDSIGAYPTSCKKCGERITESHHRQFKEIMSATRMHLDKMKMSSVACKIWLKLSFF